jgi:hypothetical protein
MITEIVTFPIPDSMTRDQVIAHFEATMPGWAANPDLIRKNDLYDPEARQGGGVYLWKTLAAAKAGHGARRCAASTVQPPASPISKHPSSSTTPSDAQRQAPLTLGFW